MDKNKNQMKFSKNMKNDFYSENTNPQEKVTQREIAKNKLMKKYNLSLKQAEIVLNQLEKGTLNEKPKNRNDTKSPNPQSNHKSPNIKSEKLPKEKTEKPNNTKNDLIPQYEFPEKQKYSINTENTNSIEKEEDSLQKSEKTKQDVDDLISNIIPDYKKYVAVELEHVDLTFEIENDKIDTIKETVIRTLEGTKSKKIKFKALNDITFKIYKGEKIGVIGYNGAGKSTLLNVISGIYPPDCGKVITKGKISPLLSLGAGFDYNYSGRKNILLNGAVLGYDKQFLKEKMDEIIEFSELGEFIDYPIKNYSSGMLAKLGFSIATALNPEILIIDEILGVGDITFRKKSSDKIKSLIESGTTVILVSHSIPSIRELCDKAIWIDKGKVRAIGEVNEICDNYMKDAEKATRQQLQNIQFK